MSLCSVSSFLFFFNDTATTEIYTLSLHDALPISRGHLARLTTPRAQEGVQVIAKVKIASAVRRLRGKDAPLIAGLWHRPNSLSANEIGRAHVWTPVTVKSRMPSSSCKKKKNLPTIRSTFNRIATTLS